MSYTIHPYFFTHIHTYIETHETIIITKSYILHDVLWRHPVHVNAFSAHLYMYLSSKKGRICNKLYSR